MESLNSKNRLLLVLNPVSGKGQGKYNLFEYVEAFSRYGYRVTVMLTDPDGETESMVIQEAKNYDKIVAVGGDGTLNTVASAIIKSGADVPFFRFLAEYVDCMPKTAKAWTVQLILFGAGLLIYAVCTLLAARISVNNYEKVDVQ